MVCLLMNTREVPFGQNHILNGGHDMFTGTNSQKSFPFPAFSASATDDHFEPPEGACILLSSLGTGNPKLLWVGEFRAVPGVSSDSYL